MNVETVYFVLFFRVEYDGRFKSVDFNGTTSTTAVTATSVATATRPLVPLVASSSSSSSSRIDVAVNKILRQKIETIQSEKNTFSKYTIGKIVSKSLDNLYIDLEKNEQLVLDSMNNGVYISARTKVDREGLDHVVSKFDCFFRSDSDILCVCCNQYNVLSSCLLDFNSSLYSDSLLCLSCLVLRSSFPDEFEKGGIDIATIISMTPTTTAYGDSTGSDCIDLCYFHKLVIKCLGLQAVLTHGDSVRKNLIIKSYINREVKRVFSSFLVLDDRAVSVFSWMIVSHCFMCLCTVDNKKKSRSSPSIKDFYMCFQDSSVDIVRSSIGSSLKFYHFVNEACCKFFDVKCDSEDVSSSSRVSRGYYRLSGRWNSRWKAEKVKLEQRLKTPFFTGDSKQIRCDICFKPVKLLIDEIKHQICKEDHKK